MILVKIHEACTSTDQVMILDDVKDLEEALCKELGDKLVWKIDQIRAEKISGEDPDNEPLYITIQQIKQGEIVDLDD